MRQCLGEGVAPVFFVTLPDAADPLTDQAIARWIDEIYRRQTFDLRPWHDAGEKAHQQAHVKVTLEKLHASVRERLVRAKRARCSPANVLRHNPQFVGRVRELTELRQALMKNKLGVVGARPPGVMATVQGVGGMGKTELALAYAHAFAWDYPGGHWQLRCEHIADLRVALLQLAGPMGFEFTDEENESLALGFERVLRELKRRERSLLVLDNVGDPGLLAPEYLDRLPRDGRVDLIATTRLAPASIPGSAQDQRFIAVDELPEEDAVALLRSHQPNGRFPNQAEDDEARAIARLLGGFTLAVETAAIYLGRHAGLDSCQRLRERLEAGSERFPTSEEIAKDPTVAVRHRERLLGKTLAFTLETLSPEALHLLTLASLLPADSIALPWLQAVGANTSRAFHDDPGEPNSVFRRTVDLLLGLRLFHGTDVASADGRLLVGRMHRLVQEYVKGEQSAKTTMSEPALLEHVKSRAQFLWDGWVAHKHRWELGPLAACAWQWMERGSTDGAYLAGHAAGPLDELGKFAEAEPLMRRELASDEASYGPDHPTVATDLNDLAKLLEATNRLAEAEPLMRRALAIYEKSVGLDRPSVATALNNLAALLKATNRLAEAEPLFRRALAIAEASHGPDNPDVAIDINNLANLLAATNRPAEAEPLYRRAPAIDEAFYGPDNPNVDRDLNNLALLLQATNRRAEAEPLFRRALAIGEASYGPDHPDVATALNSLALLLQASNRLAEAEPLFRRALAIGEASYGPDHPTVATALNNLALLLQAINRLAEAEPRFRRALAIDEASCGPDHPDVARDLNNLAELLRGTNRLADAEPLYRRAIAIDEASYGPDHPEVAIDLNNLAILLAATNRLAEAEPFYRRALAIDEASYSPDHPDVARDLNNLAALLRATNRLGEAEPLCRPALAIGEQCLGANHPEAIADYTEAIRLDPSNTSYVNNRGRAYFESKQYDRAIANYDAALRIDPRFAVSYFNRGLAREAMRDRDSAIADFAECVELEPSNMTYRNQLDATKGRRG